MTEVISAHGLTLLCPLSIVMVGPGAVRASVSAVDIAMLALVVDDSMLIRYTVSRFLEERGYTVESATNGVEALEVVARLVPDLIFTDIKMPRMSGTELISALKSKPETAKVPIIIVASRASGFEKSEQRADFVIYKDINVEEQLAKALDTVLGMAGRSQAAGK